MPLDAQVEIAAKKAAGYFAPAGAPTRARSAPHQGREPGRVRPRRRGAAPLLQRRRGARALRDRACGGRARRDPAFPAGAGAARRGGRARRRDHAPPLSRSRRAVSQPLAPFFGRRRRPRRAGRARRRSGGDGAGAARSGDRLGLARCRRRAALVVSRGRDRAASRRAPRGLAVASLRAMQAGLFSADPAKPVARRCGGACGADGRIGSATALQHRPDNPLAGLEGRAALLRRLGAVIARAPEIFGQPARLGNLLRLLAAVPRPARRRRTCCAPAPAGAGADLAGAADAGRRAARRLRPAFRGARRRAGAVAQAQPVAGLFAGRAAGRGRLRGHATSTG